MEEEKPKKAIRGGVNLAILGAVSIVVAVATTSVSLAIYHNSGDIYLDRSRPGFLPDQEEIDQGSDEKPESSYDFAKENLTAEGLQNYIDKLTEELKTIDAYENPFDLEILSDEHFGIPSI